MQTCFDVVIIGAGGAGMMCAIQAGQRGRKVLILDHAHKLGGKILISGGGRCNFTNLGASPAQYVSENPHFCKSALSRYPAQSFIHMVKEHQIPFHEKKLGQLFCDHSAQAIVNLLKTECDHAGVEFRLGQKIKDISREEVDQLFSIQTSFESLTAQTLVIATGGLSIPKLGATGFGYEIAKKFGLKLIERAPALDGFTFEEKDVQIFRSLAGVSIDCLVSCGGMTFRENILFTHSGLSGPAALQASLYWRKETPIIINLLPDMLVLPGLLAKKREGNRSLMKNILADLLPSRFASLFCDLYWPSQLSIGQTSDKELENFSQRLHSWTLFPSGTVGYSKAEVTRGGVDTHELSSKTMEAKKVPGLYFVGEVIDVTGWLGGYNFQWAWASGWAAGQVV